MRLRLPKSRRWQMVAAASLVCGSVLTGGGIRAFSAHHATPKVAAAIAPATEPAAAPSPAGDLEPIPASPVQLLPAPQTAAAPNPVHVATSATPMLRWVYMVGPQLPDSIRQHPDQVDVLSPQWFHLDADGNIYGSDSPEVTQFAKAHGIKLMPAIVNGEFDADAAHDILSDGSNQTRALDSLTALVRTNGYDGINIDFENLYAGDRQLFSGFMANLYARLHRENGRAVTIALPSKTQETFDGWSGPFDYAAIAPNVDLAVVMTYDDHNTLTGPGPVAPIDWDESVLKYATKSIPPSKLLLGLPFYGYDWNLWTGWTRAVSYSDIVRTVFAFGPGIQMDAGSQTPTYTYVAGDGTHQVWFENSSSLAAKVSLAAKYGLAGWGAWRAGQEDQNFWSLNLTSVGRAAPVPLVPPVQPAPSAPPSPPAPAAPAPSPQPPAPAPAPPASIIVAPGDTVSAIAARLGTSVEALIAANRLTPDGWIQIGQQLVMPGSAPAPAPAAAAPAAAAPPPPANRTITVGVGDTLSSISARYGASVQTLLRANGLRSPDRIQAGQRLTIPAA